MSNPGPPSTPTRLKILRGNPGKRKINKNEPQPSEKGVRCPEWLSPESKNVWKKIAPQLKSLKLLTLVDVNEFALYCGYMAEYITAYEFIQKNGLTYESNSGLTKVYPQVRIARDAARMASSLASKFGLSPSDRVKFDLPKEKEKNEFDEFLNPT